MPANSGWNHEIVRLSYALEEDWELFYEQNVEGTSAFWQKNKFFCPVSKELAERQWKQLLTEKAGKIFRIESFGKELVGYLQIGEEDTENGIFTAFVYIRPEARRRGCATATLRLFFHYMYWERRFHKFYTLVTEDEAAVVALLCRVGCVREAVLPDMMYRDKKYQPLFFYGMTAQDYEKYTITEN